MNWLPTNSSWNRGCNALGGTGDKTLFYSLKTGWSGLHKPANLPNGLNHENSRYIDNKNKWFKPGSLRGGDFLWAMTKFTWKGKVKKMFTFLLWDSIEEADLDSKWTCNNSQGRCILYCLLTQNNDVELSVVNLNTYLILAGSTSFTNYIHIGI